MINNPEKKEKFLGETPKNINEENLLNYFLYVYEFNWSSPVFENNRNNIEEFFRASLKQVEEKLSNQIDVNKKWWVLNLIALREYAKHENLHYSLNVINSLLSKIDKLTLLELEEYTNLIQSSYVKEIFDIFTVRPLVMKTLGSSVLDEDIELNKMLDNSDKFIRIFKKHLLQKDINKKYIDEILINKKCVTKEFCGFWDKYFELYCGIVLELVDLFAISTNEVKCNQKDRIRDLSEIFLKTTVLKEDKIKKLNDDLVEVLYPCLVIDEE